MQSPRSLFRTIINRQCTPEVLSPTLTDCTANQHPNSNGRRGQSLRAQCSSPSTTACHRAFLPAEIYHKAFLRSQTYSSSISLLCRCTQRQKAMKNRFGCVGSLFVFRSYPSCCYSIRSLIKYSAYVALLHKQRVMYILFIFGSLSPFTPNASRPPHEPLP